MVTAFVKSSSETSGFTSMLILLLLSTVGVKFKPNTEGLIFDGDGGAAADPLRNGNGVLPARQEVRRLAARGDERRFRQDLCQAFLLQSINECSPGGAATEETQNSS